MKKLLATMLALLMALTLLPTAVFAAEPQANGLPNAVDGVYTLTSDVTLNDNVTVVAKDKDISENTGVIEIKATGKMVFDGNNKIITADDFLSSAKNHVINVSSGDVTIKNLTIFGNENTRHGINVYGEGTKVILENVTIRNCGTAAIVINKGEVTATNLTTSGNTWGAINVDNGGKLTLDTTTKLSETLKVWSESGSKSTVTISDTQYSASVTTQKGSYNYYSSNAADLGVAAIDKNVYATLSAAVTAAGNAATTITMVNGWTENVTIPAEANITLDLNGQKLVNKDGNTITVEKGATLTINGTGTVDNVSNGKAALYNKGTVILNGGTYTRSAETGKNKDTSGANTWYNILNHGTMTINKDVTVKQGGGFSSLVVNGYQNTAQVNAQAGAANPTMTITGGTFESGLNTIKNDDNGNLTITGGTFKNYTQSCVQNHHIATIEGGTYTSDVADAYALLNCGTTCPKVVETDKHELTITGGTFTGNIRKSLGFIKIEGGTFTTNPSEYVNDKSFAVTKGTDGKYTVAKAADNSTSSVILPTTSGSGTGSGSASTSTETTATITKSDIDTNKGLVVKDASENNVTSVTFNSTAAGTIVTTAEGVGGDESVENLTLTVTTKEGKDSTNVANENKDAYAEATENTDTTNAVVVSIDLKAGDTKLFTASDVANATDEVYAIVEVPYKIGLKDVTVQYLDGSEVKTLTKVAVLSDLGGKAFDANNYAYFYYNSTTGVITMKLPHFSQYLLNGTEPVDPNPTPTTLYTVTFNANGGTVTPTTAVTGANGNLSSLPTPTRNNYSFDGWYTAANGGTQVTTSTAFTADTTVYAHWTRNHYRPSRPSSGSGSTTTTTPTVAAPKTFDAGIAIYGVMAISSVLGMGYMGKKKF